MIEENGHIWESGNSNERCRKCGMKLGYYFEVKEVSQKLPDRQDLKDWMECKEAKER